MQTFHLGNPQMTPWRDSSVLNAATHNVQLWGHFGTDSILVVVAQVSLFL